MNPPIQQRAEQSLKSDQISIDVSDERPTNAVCGNALAALASAEELELPAQHSSNPAISNDTGWIEFRLEHGRVPMVGDVKKPWEYPGWLLYYRLLLEEHPEVGKRWDYWWRTKLAGTLLDEPIPSIEFRTSSEVRAGLKLFHSWISIVGQYHCHSSAPPVRLLVAYSLPSQLLAQFWSRGLQRSRVFLLI